eukprot:6199306-Pleurochrysis_carterae.AAC.2
MKGARTRLLTHSCRCAGVRAASPFGTSNGLRLRLRAAALITPSPPVHQLCRRDPTSAAAAVGRDIYHP